METGDEVTEDKGVVREWDRKTDTISHLSM